MNAEYLRDLFYRIASPQHSEQRVETSRFCGLAVLHGRLDHSASQDVSVLGVASNSGRAPRRRRCMASA
jgi:hypothetical protein